MGSEIPKTNAVRSLAASWPVASSSNDGRFLVAVPFHATSEKPDTERPEASRQYHCACVGVVVPTATARLFVNFSRTGAGALTTTLQYP
jgi:hypothetical protein